MSFPPQHSSLDNHSTTLCNKRHSIQTHSDTSMNDSSSCRSTPTAGTAPLSPKERSPYKHHEVTHSDHILRVMDEMRITGKFVDLILIAEDKEIPCHKVRSYRFVFPRTTRTVGGIGTCTLPLGPRLAVDVAASFVSELSLTTSVKFVYLIVVEWSLGRT